MTNPYIGLLFLVPSVNETLRVNGCAKTTTDDTRLAACAVNGRPPAVGIVMEVQEVFFHCARAFLRAGLWDPGRWPDRSGLPTLGRQALWLARLLGRDPLRTWALAVDTINRVAARQPLLRQRPRIVTVTCKGGEEPMLVRGTCCLSHRTVERADPDGDGYCETCPLRTQASRARRLCARLDKPS